jgi:hypothetical protein
LVFCKSFLSIGDNTSALGWIHKSNFHPESYAEQSSHLALARHITTMLADLEVIQCGQWLPGDDNAVADKLSREHVLSNHDLTELIVSIYPSQTPIGFRISPLPPAIISWATYWMHHTRETKESPPELFPRATRGGNGGWSSCTTANSTTTSSLDNLQHTKGICFSEPLPSPPVIASGRNPRRDMTTWLQNHAVPSLTQFARPSLSPDTMIPGKTPMESWHSFYNAK